MYCENARIYIHRVFYPSVQTIQIADYSFGSIQNPVWPTCFLYGSKSPVLHCQREEKIKRVLICLNNRSVDD